MYDAKAVKDYFRNMWIAVRLPLLPLEIFARGSSAPEPFAVEERHAILACNDEAAVRGVCAGMASPAALALVPALRIVARDPAGEAEALAGMAAWAGQFTPRVSLEPPATLLLEVSGSLKLFRGLEALAGALRWGAAEMGYGTIVAAAPTARAASWLAAAGHEKLVADAAQLEPALASLPVSVLGCSKDELQTLDGIGVATLGELRALPRAGVARRFPAALLDALDRERLRRRRAAREDLERQQGKANGDPHVAKAFLSRTAASAAARWARRGGCRGA